MDGIEEELQVGASATLTLPVTDKNTALTLRSGSIPVLAMPALICAMEEAACAVLEGRLEEGIASVGTHVSADHLSPTVTGGQVKVTATLTAVEGRMLTFSIEASDAAGTVGMGTHTRVLVNIKRFMDKACARLQV